MTATFDIVVACDLTRGIGKNGQLPWRLPGDLKHFRELTAGSAQSQNAVIMGRKTWESIPAKFRPLPDRMNVVLTRRGGLELPAGVMSAPSLDDALNLLSGMPVGGVFVIGGGEVYAEALKHPGCRRIFLTEVKGTFDCDTYLSDYSSDFAQVEASELREESGMAYSFKVFARKGG